jgi:6-phosphogluconolactonase (cycloisomerase 2 family)
MGQRARMIRARRYGICIAVSLLALALPETAAALTTNATTVIVSPDGSRVYAGFNGAGFSVFSRDPSTGGLTVLGEAPTTNSAGPLEGPAIAASPDGANLYGVDDQSNQLFQYGVTSTGVSEEQSYQVLPDPNVAKAPVTVSVSPDGSSVYVITAGVQYGSGVGVSGDGKINAFHRDPSNGDLTLVETTTLSTNPNEAGAGGTTTVFSPDGKFGYVAADASGGVFVLSRDPSTGAVTSEGSEGQLNGANAIAISPDGNYIYEAGQPSSSTSDASAIAVLSRNATTGQLTDESEVENGSGGVTGLGDMWSLAVSPDGNCLYATSRLDNTLGYFTRNQATGALTFGGVATEGAGGVTGLSSARDVFVSPDGKNVYVASPNDNGVAVFTRNPATCAPSFIGLAQDLFTLSQPVLNQGQGTAMLPVDVQTAGSIDLSLQPLAGQAAERRRAEVAHRIAVPGPGQVNVPISLAGPDEAKLDRLHRLTVQAAVTFTASNGTPTTKTVVIALVKLPASISRLRIRPRKLSLASRCTASRRRSRTRRACAKPAAFAVSYTLSQAATVTFSVAQDEPGRQVRRRCLTPTHRNRKDRRCTRLVNRPGRISKSAKTGANRFTFTGKIGGHRLGPGTYVLTATPAGGRPAKTSFTITG